MIHVSENLRRQATYLSSCTEEEEDSVVLNDRCEISGGMRTALSKGRLDWATVISKWEIIRK